MRRSVAPVPVVRRPSFSVPYAVRVFTVLVSLGAVALGVSGTAHARSEPEIELAWPQPAAVGELVVIRGQGFHPKAGKNQVRFGSWAAEALDVVEVGDGGSELMVTVPLGARADGALPLVVEVNGRRSAPLDFFLRPVVVAGELPVLPAGSTARLTLQVLGSEQPELLEVVTLTPERATLGGRVSDTVRSQGVEQPGERLDAEEANREADQGEERQNRVTVTVTAPSSAADRTGRTEAPEIFARPLPSAADLACPEPLGWLGRGPQILEIVPAGAGAGQPVRVRGRGFGDAKRALRVTLGDQPIEILDLQPGEILVQLPPDARSGPG